MDFVAVFMLRADPTVRDAAVSQRFDRISHAWSVA